MQKPMFGAIPYFMPQSSSGSQHFLQDMQLQTSQLSKWWYGVKWRLCPKLLTSSGNTFLESQQTATPLFSPFNAIPAELHVTLQYRNVLLSKNRYLPRAQNSCTCRVLVQWRFQTLLTSVAVLFVFIILCAKGCLTETCLTYTETHTQTDTLTTDGHCINLYRVVLLFNYKEISLKL